MSTINIDLVLKEFSFVKARRAPWDRMFDLIAKFIFTRKYGFTSESSDGQFFVHGDVFDDTAPRALGQMVSSITGALWKNGARTFRIVKPATVKESTEVKEHYTEINRRLVRQMEHPRAGFGTSFIEYMYEDAAFGTAGLGTFKAKAGAGHLIEYRAMGLKHLWVCEDASGRVVKIFYEVGLNAFQLYDEYGEAVMADSAVKAAIEAMNYDKKFNVLWLMRPRAAYNPSIQNNQNMPIESLHILVSSKILVREAGFQELPVPVTRFYKNEGEEYGRAPGMEALPSVITLNALWEIMIRAAEKKENGALWMLDDGSFGNGILDRSPGALNILDNTARITSGPPLGVLADVGDLTPEIKLMEALAQQIVSHFLVDRLLDLNNQTRMTLGEAQIRNEMRADSLGGIFNRQIDECLTPTIQRSIGICVEEGEFGVIAGTALEQKVIASGKKPIYIPQALIDADADGEEIYNIEYISPAARILRSEELRGVMNLWQFAGAFAGAVPEFLIQLDKAKSLRQVGELGGATSEVFLSSEEFEKEMAKFAEAQQVNAEMMMKKVSAEIAAKMGAAHQQDAQANATAMGASGVMGGAPGGGGEMLL